MPTSEIYDGIIIGMINKLEKIKQERWNDMICVYGYRSNDIKLQLNYIKLQFISYS